MNNLVKLSSVPTFDYDWSLVEDLNNRAVASTAVKTYAKTFNSLRSQAEQIIKDDNLAKSKCVYQLKLSLPHGQFQDVCTKALGLNERTASALASTGKLLMDGNYTDDVIEMVRVMEPRASNQFLKMDNDSKSDHVVRFQETGKVPSQNDFVNRDKTTPPRPKITNKPSSMSESSFDSITRRLKNNDLRVPDLLKWMIRAVENNEPSEDTKELIAQLYAVSLKDA